MKKYLHAVGLMSGTSMDGVDAVLLKTDGKSFIKRLAKTSLKYDKNFMLALKSQTRQNIDPSIVQQSTELHALAVKKLFKKIPSLNLKIDLIGFHGQTIYHNAEEKISLQIGHSQYLANQFNLPVIEDFRSQDILNGGQGAPLAPLYHQALMHQKQLDNLAVINCGGIANLTLISENKILAGFDTGPGNVLLDRFVREFTHNQCLMDTDGKFAQQGKIDERFLALLFEKTLKNNFYHKLPPKSLDTQDIIFTPEIYQRFFNPLYLKPKSIYTPDYQSISKNLNLTDLRNLYDGCAVLTAFTAYVIAKSLNNIKNLMKIPENWVICGGGAKNPALISALNYFLSQAISQPVNFKTAVQMGWSNIYMEAELIAWLAVRSVKKLFLTLPETTGVKKPVTGGRCVYPQL